jgi:hypothetical protein
VGTGFIISPRLTVPTGERFIFIATNKHIVSDWIPADRQIYSYRKNLVVYFHGGPHGPYTPFTIPLLDSSDKLIPTVCLGHPDDSVDVALIWINRRDIFRDIAFGYDIIDESLLLPFKQIISQMVGLGDQVFALGYPSGVTSLTTSYPIAKAGYIASNPGEPFHLRYPFLDRDGKPRPCELHGNLLIVDGLILPGNSGGPVILPSELKVRRHPRTNQLQFASAQTQNYCIGLVSSGIPASGLTIVYACDYLLELMRLYTNMLLSVIAPPPITPA